jgi:hypothetical protein
VLSIVFLGSIPTLWHVPMPHFCIHVLCMALFFLIPSPRSGTFPCSIFLVHALCMVLFFFACKPTPRRVFFRATRHTYTDREAKNIPEAILKMATSAKTYCINDGNINTLKKWHAAMQKKSGR